MPSLNLSTQTLRYTAPDERLLRQTAVLLRAMRDYDGDVFERADRALDEIEALLNHVEKQRGTKYEPTKPQDAK